jgi:hypothetical protein
MRAKQPGTIEGLFAGRPGSLALFKAVRRFIETLGPVKVEATKTQVSFGAATKFAWVWLPQIWIKKRPETSITLTFDAGHRIDDPRIAAAVEPRPGRWTHHVVLEKASGLDAKVKCWLREAYESGKIDRRRRRPKA